MFNAMGGNDDAFIPEYSQEGRQDETSDNIITEDAPQESQGQEPSQEQDQEPAQNQEPAPQEPQAEVKKYAGKFDSPEDLEKAYMNLQPNFTKVAQELSRMKKGNVAPPIQQVQQPVGQGYQQAQSQTDYPGVTDSITREVYNQVYNSVAIPLAQQLEAQNQMTETLVIENELVKMANRYEDFAEVAPLMDKVLQEKPAWLKTMQPDEYLELAYLVGQKAVNEVKAERKLQEARKEAYKSREIKVLNNPVGGTVKNTQGSAPKSAAQQVVDDIFAENNSNKSIFKFI